MMNVQKLSLINTGVIFGFCNSLLAILLSFNTYAGSQAIMQESDKTGVTPNQTVISAEGNLLRIESRSSNNVAGSLVIFDTLKKEMLLIEHQNQSYTRMNKSQFDVLNQKMLQVRKTMQEQLAKLPPEQQQMMKKMMSDKMNISFQQEKKISRFISTERTDKAIGIDCKIVEHLVNDIKSHEYCIVPFSKVEGAGDIFKGMKAMGEMFRELYQSMSDSFPMLTNMNPLSEVDKLNGFPLIISNFKNGKKYTKNKLVNITPKSFDKVFFLPPDGYQEKKIDFQGF